MQRPVPRVPTRRRRVAAILALLGLTAGLVVSTGASAADGPPGLERARAAKEAHADALFGATGVVGVGVARGESGASVIVLTRDTKVRVPSAVDGVPVRVVVTGEIRAAHHRPGHSGGPGGTTTTTSPGPTEVAIGTSTGRGDECSAGTIGAKVTDGVTDFALSNNHVWARENDATVGDDIYQPGLFDTGCVASPANQFADLEEWVDLQIGGSCSATSVDNVVDAALADPLDTRPLGTATPPDGYGAPSTQTSPPALVTVQKYGRTSNLTEGTVVAIDVDVNIAYDGGIACFRDQIWVSGRKPFLKAGDSGSLLVTAGASEPMGLLFAADSSGKNAFANPIGDVLSAFGVQMASS